MFQSAPFHSSIRLFRRLFLPPFPDFFFLFQLLASFNWTSRRRGLSKMNRINVTRFQLGKMSNEYTSSLTSIFVVVLFLWTDFGVTSSFTISFLTIFFVDLTS